MARCLLLWAQCSLRSLRAVHLLGKLNQGADILSQGNVSPGEWRLHPQMIQIIWLVFEKEEVDLFTLEDNFHCPKYFSKEQDALVHNWPNVHLPLHYIYAFSRRFYPKRLTVHSGYTFSVSLCVPWELNPQRFALLTQCSTTEPQEHLYVFPQISLFPQVIRRVREVRCSPLL